MPLDLRTVFVCADPSVRWCNVVGGAGAGLVAVISKVGAEVEQEQTPAASTIQQQRTVRGQSPVWRWSHALVSEVSERREDDPVPPGQQ